MKGLICILVNEDCEVCQVESEVAVKWIQEVFDGQSDNNVVVDLENFEESLKNMVQINEAEVIEDGSEYEIEKFIKEKLELVDCVDEYDGLEEDVNEILGVSWIEGCDVVKYMVPFEYDGLFIWLFK